MKKINSSLLFLHLFFYCLILFSVQNIFPQGAKNCLLFSESIDEYVEISDAPSLDITEELTVEAWIYMVAPGNSDGIVSKSSFTTNYTYSSYLIKTVSNSRCIEFWVTQSGGIGTYNYIRSTKVIPYKKWTHICCVFKPSTYTRIYINGVLDVEYTSSIISNIFSSPSTFKIGRDAPNASNFPGYIDEVRIWDKALSDTMIRKWMNKSITSLHPYYSNLKGYWKLDEGTDTLTVDSSPNGNNGILVNSPNWTLSNAPIGDACRYAINPATLPETTDVSLSIDAWNDNPGSGSVYSTVQVNTFPDINTGLGTFVPNRYWEIWIANEDSNYRANLVFHYNGISGITDESKLKIFGRTGPGQIWYQLPDYSIDYEGSTTDGNGSLTLLNQVHFYQYILTSGTGEQSYHGYNNTLEFAEWTNNYIEIPDNSNLDITGEITIEAWVYLISTGNYDAIVSKSYRTSGIGYTNTAYLVKTESTSRCIAFWFTASGTESNFENLIGSKALPLNKWTHVCCVFKPSTYVKTFINGVLDVQRTSGVISSIYNSSVNFKIGKDFSYASSFPGKIDEVRIWNKALDQSTIQKWMNKKVTSSHPNYSNLKGYWRLDEGSGITVKDLSPSNNTGYFVNDPVWEVSTSPLGDNSHFGSGNSSLAETSDVQIAIPNWNNNPGTGAVFSAIQFNHTPDSSRGLLSYYSNKYWQFWIANDDGSYSANLVFHYDGLNGIGDESTLKLYSRTAADQPWSEELSYSIDYEGNQYDGVGSVSLNAQTIFKQYILSSTNNPLQPTYAHLKVYLQGPFSNGKMSTTLNTAEVIPLNQPYNVSPWNYNGNESVASIPEGVVDWVLIDIRSDLTTSKQRRACFLKEDGTIVDLDGTSKVVLTNVLNGYYYIVVYHRNHLAIMSSVTTAIDQTSVLYDYTNSQTNAYGTDAMKEIIPGVYGLYAGDGNASGTISSTDRNAVWRPQNGQSGYLMGDFNLSGNVSAIDRNTFWRTNNGKNSQVP